MTAISYITATSAVDFENARKLFRLYADSLNVDLCFQDFDKELLSIDRQYNRPAGALILAYDGQTAVGCAGIRAIDPGIAELKRMYVLDEYRNQHIGQQILLRCVEIASELKYRKIRLDTLPSMKKAQELYRTMGFYEIPSYRFNPVEGTIYMEKNLGNVQ